MKVILNFDDVKNLIKCKYNVKDTDIITENDDMEITLNIDSNSLEIKKDNVFIPKDAEIIHVNPDEKQKTEALAGGMASGGERRNIVNVG